MNCLCCGKPLKTDDGSGWHRACIKRFFGTTGIPEIEIDEAALEIQAAACIGNGVTVAGVQKKLSLPLPSGKDNLRPTLINTGYILKPQVKEFICMPEAEQLVMNMADAAGISTVPHGLLRRGENIAYITKRIDRVSTETGVRRLAMEDFCQLDLRLTEHKYNSSYERCAKVIQRYSSQVGLDMAELFLRVVFSFVTGNSDMHLKNFSLIETAEASCVYVLSPVYDLLPVNVVMPEDKEELALTLNGKKMNIRRKDFLAFAEKCELPSTSAEKMIKKIVSLEAVFEKICKDSLLPPEMKARFTSLINTRCRILNQ